MALNGTYSGLQASIADWLIRADLASVIPDFIALVDADLNSLTERLRLQETDQSLAMATGSRFVELPAGYIEPLALWIEWPWGRAGVDETSASLLQTSNAAGRPYFWCVDGETLAFERPADKPYSLTFRMVTAFGLAGALEPSTYVLKTYPNAYLFGALLKATPYIKDDGRIATWQGMYNSALASMTMKEARSRLGAPLRVDPALAHHRRCSILHG